MEGIREENLRAKAWAADIVNQIYDDLRPCMVNKESHPISDFKDLLESTARRFPDNVAFMQKWETRSEYKKITYRQVLEEVNALGTALIAKGLKDKRIAVIGPNCYQWCTVYLAVTGGVGCIVPMDKELNAEELKQQVKRAGVSAVAFDGNHLETFKAIKNDGDTNLEILINYNEEDHQDDVYSWKKLLEEGKALVSQGDDGYINAEIDNEAMSIIIFTSGTTGKPKGVMLSQKNICQQLMTIPTVAPLKPEDRFLSFLPIHHTFECTCGILLPIYKGASVAFSHSKRYVMRNMKEAHPTVIIGVPSFYEKLYKTIWKNIKKQEREKAAKRSLFLNSLAHRMGMDFGNKMFSDVKELFGGRLHTMVCGGAIVNPKVLEGFKKMGFNAIQGYGLTEASPVVAVNPPGDPDPASLGVPLPCQEIKIVNHDKEGIGEICVRGDNIMLGYFDDPEETERVLSKDGWLHTGDLGYIDSDGYLYLTGRQKNIIITKNGKNVYPEEIENQLDSIDFIEESYVYEDEKSSGLDTLITAAIKVNVKEVEAIMGPDFTDEDVKALVWKYVDKINSKAPVYRQISRVILRKSSFTRSASSKIMRIHESNKSEE